MEENNNNLNSQAQFIDDSKKDENNSNFKQLKQLIDNLEYYLLNINRLDYYSNTIPLGSFCNAVTFILYGFNLCYVFNCEIFLNGVLLIFGGIGQITTGALEFFKQRTFPCIVYFTYGLFCLSLYFIKANIFENLNSKNIDMCAFYGAWMIISIPITISSIKINLFFVVQTFLTSAFFVLEVIGQGFNEKKVINNTGGVILSISGFVSLYIFLTQIINEAVKFPLLPACPIKPDNEVDITQDYRGNYIEPK